VARGDLGALDKFWRDEPAAAIIGDNPPGSTRGA
jgi:hypothetical protein